MKRPVEIAAAAATLSLIAWSAVMPAFGRPPRAEAVLSPFHRKRNLPDQLRVRPSSDRSGIAYRAIGADDLTGIAHLEVDVWVILRWFIPNALELAAANAHDRHPDFIVKRRITFHLQRAA